MKKTEITLAIISIIALGLKLLFITGGSILTVFTLIILSIIYCYFSFLLFNDIPLKQVFKKDSYKNISGIRILGAVFTGFGLSAITLGLMFKFQSWPGADPILIAGLFVLLPVTIIALSKYSKNKSNFYPRIFKRIAIWGGLGLILTLMPKTTWIEIKYRNQPAYVEALKNAMADPDNKELWDKVKMIELEQKKMNGE
jgi:hypothetical protein